MNRCGVCKVDLEVRPVERMVRSSRFDRKLNRSVPLTYTENIHCKPIQLVISVRLEGSQTHDEQPCHLQGLDKLLNATGVRICARCLSGKSGAEVLAVWLDSQLEAG